MPTVFDQPDDGDLTHVSHVNQYAAAVNALESGAAYWAGQSAGTSTAYTASLTPAANDNTAGTIVNLTIDETNTGASTLAVNGHNALPIRKNGVAVVAGDLVAGAAYSFITDATYWHVIGGGGSAGSTNASTAFTSGQVPLARGGTGADLSATGGAGQYVKQASAGGVFTVGAIAAGDLPNHSAGLLTSGTVALARGGVGADISATGGTGQYLKQASAGGAVTVGTIPAADLPNHSTSLLTSGQLALARGGTGADLSATGGTGQVLRQSSAGGAVTVSALTYTDVGAAAASHAHNAGTDITSGTLPVARGGTGLGSLGSALQSIRVNAGGTALEYYTPAGGGIALDDLSDVVISSPATGHFVRYNGSNFVNVALVAGDIPSTLGPTAFTGAVSVSGQISTGTNVVRCSGVQNAIDNQRQMRFSGGGQGTNLPELVINGYQYSGSGGGPGTIGLKAYGTTRASNGTWTQIYSLADGEHHGSFYINDNLGDGEARYPINGTTLGTVEDKASGITYVDAGSIGASNVGLRINSGWVEINVGTSVTASTKFGVRFEGMVV